MLRHVVMIKWRPGATEAQKQALIEGTRQLAREIPLVRAMHCGTGLGLMPGTFDFAMVADFDSEHDWAAYRKHAAHTRFVEQALPAAGETARIQFRLDE